MHTFRITFTRYCGQRSKQTQIVFAESIREAMKLIDHPYRTHSVSVRCTGECADGSQCRRFCVEDRCPAHAAGV